MMGTADPDFPDAEAEASFQAEILHAKKVMIEGAGHHPQADSPEEFASTLIEFMVEHQETDILAEWKEQLRASGCSQTPGGAV
ncbi:MAG: alpha/beta hydrolase [Gemmatimonadetes bacterium]|nr:alpha/beta hydrolase [Gemmatimonadota bacterium]